MSGKKDKDFFDTDNLGLDFEGFADIDMGGSVSLEDCDPFNAAKHGKGGDWFSGKKLGSVGYDVDDSTSKRRKALRKMIGVLQDRGLTKDEAAYKTWQKLHGIYVTWKNQSGYSQSDIKAVRRDRDWVSENYDMDR